MNVQAIQIKNNGRSAYWAGDSDERNPYAHGDPNRDYWLKGWIEAMEDDQEAQDAVEWGRGDE